MLLLGLGMSSAAPRGLPRVWQGPQLLQHLERLLGTRTLFAKPDRSEPQTLAQLHQDLNTAQGLIQSNQAHGLRKVFVGFRSLGLSAADGDQELLWSKASVAS